MLPLFRDGVARCAEYLIKPYENYVFAAPQAGGARWKIQGPATLSERKDFPWKDLSGIIYHVPQHEIGWKNEKIPERQNILTNENVRNQPYVPLAEVDNKGNEDYSKTDCTFLDGLSVFS